MTVKGNNRTLLPIVPPPSVDKMNVSGFSCHLHQAEWPSQSLNPQPGFTNSDSISGELTYKGVELQERLASGCLIFQTYRVMEK